MKDFYSGRIISDSEYLFEWVRIKNGDTRLVNFGSYHVFPNPIPKFASKKNRNRHFYSRALISNEVAMPDGFGAA